MTEFSKGAPPVLEAPGCVLRRPGPGHGKDLFAVYGHRDTMRYMQRPPAETVSHCEELIAKWNDDFHKGVSFRWGIFASEEPHRLIGTAALHYWSASNRSIELGADLHRDYHGKGLATAITTVLIRCAFKDLNANRVELRCDPGNGPSVSIASKMGFTYEGTLREYVFVPGKGFVDESVYSLLKREWKGEP